MYFLLRVNYVIYSLDVVTFFDYVRITSYLGTFKLRTEITLWNDHFLVTFVSNQKITKNYVIITQFVSWKCKMYQGGLSERWLVICKNKRLRRPTKNNSCFNNTLFFQHTSSVSFQGLHEHWLLLKTLPFLYWKSANPKKSLGR